jgi:hypothetical protein
VVGAGRRRDLEVGELVEQELDRLRIRALVHAVERLAPAPREQGSHRLVRGDHQLLDEHVGERLPLDPGSLDAALPVEGEGDLSRLDPQGAPAVPAAAQRLGHLLCEQKRRRQFGVRPLAAGEDRLRLPVCEALAAPDQAAIEARLAGDAVGAEGDLDRDAASLLVRAEAAEIGRELLAEHRLHAAGDVDGEAALGRIAIERRAGRHVRRDVGDVHPGADAAVLPAQGERIVEVLRLFGIDGEREEVAQIDAIGLVLGRKRRQLRVRTSHALVPEEALQHCLDVARRPEDALEACASAAGSEDGQISDRSISGALAVDDDGDAALEVRLADEELSAPGQLADEGRCAATQRGGRRRGCRARCAAPRRAA